MSKNTKIRGYEIDTVVVDEMTGIGFRDPTLCVGSAVVNMQGEVPEQGTPFAAGSDLKITTDLVIEPGGVTTVGSGVKVEIPLGYFGLVVPRSSLSNYGIMLANTVGIIDSDYRGEIKMKFRNMTNSTVYIEEGTRLCQLVLVPYIRPEFRQVDDLEKTGRGDKGWGSTGK